MRAWHPPSSGVIAFQQHHLIIRHLTEVKPAMILVVLANCDAALAFRVDELERDEVVSREALLITDRERPVLHGFLTDVAPDIDEGNSVCCQQVLGLLWNQQGAPNGIGSKTVLCDQGLGQLEDASRSGYVGVVIMANSDSTLDRSSVLDLLPVPFVSADNVIKANHFGGASHLSHNFSTFGVVSFNDLCPVKVIFIRLHSKMCT